MAEMSRRFNFDDFDEQIREALEDNDGQMAELISLGGMRKVLRPGEIGAVPISFDLTPDDAA